MARNSGREEKNGGHEDMKPRAENARVIQYFSFVFNTAWSIGAKSAQTVIWLAKTIAIICFCGVKLDLSAAGNIKPLVSAFAGVRECCSSLEMAKGKPYSLSNRP